MLHSIVDHALTYALNVGPLYRGGFGDREADISTFTMTCTEMARASDDDRGDVTTSGFGFVEGDRDPEADWEASFDGVTLASGTGIYCMESSDTGAVPGEARQVTRFQAIGPYMRYGS